MKSLNLVAKFISDIELNDDLDKSIILAECLGELLWENNLGIYSLPEVERVILSKAMSRVNIEGFSFDALDNRVLFVVTEPFMGGGHTRLMERLAKMLDAPSDLLITGNIDNAVLERMKCIFSNVYSGTLNSQPLESVINLLRIIGRYKKIVLNIHPFDIRAVLASALVKKINSNSRFYFINHADHAFSYGVTVSDIWFEISSFGRKIDAQRCISGKSSFLGIPFGNEVSFKWTEINLPPRESVRVITSAASGFKYKPRMGFSIFPFVSRLLRDYPSAIIYIIGPRTLTDYWWWPIKIMNFRRLKILRAMPFDKYLELTARSDLYFDSHPIPGGTAFVEQYLNGVYCAGVKSPLHGYTPLEAIKVNDVCERFVSEISNDIHMRIKDVHSFASVKSRFSSVLYDEKLHDNNIDLDDEFIGGRDFFKRRDIKSFPLRFIQAALADRNIFFYLASFDLFIFCKSLLIYAAKKFLRD